MAKKKGKKEDKDKGFFIVGGKEDGVNFAQINVDPRRADKEELIKQVRQHLSQITGEPEEKVAEQAKEMFDELSSHMDKAKEAKEAEDYIMNNKEEAAKEITDSLKTLCDALHKTAITNNRMYFSVLTTCLTALTTQELKFIGQMKVVGMFADELHKFEQKKRATETKKDFIGQLKTFLHLGKRENEN